MAERVRGIENVGSPAELFGVGATGEEVSHQGFAGGDELVREDVPGTDLQPSIGHQAAHGVDSVGADSQVVLEQDGLAVEQETSEAGFRLEASDQIIDRRHESGDEPGAWQIPLAIPVRMDDQMKSVKLHGGSGRIQ